MNQQRKDEHRRLARERAQRFTARKRMDRVHPEVCNCNDPKCTGVFCNYIRTDAQSVRNVTGAQAAS